MIAGVIFDMDGVLLDSERVYFALLRQAAREQGASLSDALLETLLGSSNEDSRHTVLAAHPMLDYDKMLARWKALVCEKGSAEGFSLKKGALDILLWLKAQKHKIGLATSSDREMALLLLDKARLTPFFDAMAFGNEIRRGKPAPDIYLLCAKRLALQPHTCAGVEDSFNGVRAVRSAGMHCVMVPDIMPYTAPFAPYVDSVLKDLSMLDALIRDENR